MDDGNAYLAAGLAGMGVLWLPEYMPKEQAARGELLPFLTAGAWTQRRCTWRSRPTGM